MGTNLLLRSVVKTDTILAYHELGVGIEIIALNDVGLP